VQFADSEQVIRRTISKNHTISAVVSDVGQTGNAPLYPDELFAKDAGTAGNAPFPT
jgi:hypothetical protein